MSKIILDKYTPPTTIGRGWAKGKKVVSFARKKEAAFNAITRSFSDWCLMDDVKKLKQAEKSRKRKQRRERVCAKKKAYREEQKMFDLIEKLKNKY